jgi:lipopolysaccharide transport system ATP-binding protein
MSDIAIKVEGLGKRYKIGRMQKRHDTLRDQLMHLLRKPFSRNGLSPHHSSLSTHHLDSSDILWALKDVSFEVKRGEVIGIIGRNGAGKSTLLKILSRITEPTEGYADINGRVGSLLEVGTGFHPELTGSENIFLNGSILGMKRAEIGKKFDEIVAFAEIEKFIDTPVKHYSSGMYVRLAFAVAAHLDPEILIVDEVLAVGDVAFQKKCLGKMGDVAKEGRTVIIVSHQLQMVRNLCFRTLLLEEGQLVEIGSTEKVIASYLDDTRSSTTEWRVGEEGLGDKALPFFTLSRFAIVGEFGEALSNCIDMLMPTYIQIEGRLLLGDSRLCIGFHLFDQYDNSILMSYQTDQPEDEWPRLNPGEFCLRTKLNLETLNEGKYRLCLISGLHCVQMFYSVDRSEIDLSFELVSHQRRSPYYVGRRNVLLTPPLRWELV